MAKRKKAPQGWMTVLDVFMIILVIINLLWMGADWFFNSQIVQNYLEDHFLNVFNFYNTNIHPNFLFYDGIFVTIFVIEFLFRWLVAIVKRTHYKWFFYPFLHWYDIIGLFPVSSFRILRLLRVFSLGYRLQNQGVINFKRYPIFKMTRKYYNVVIEEISDRVVINVIENVQEDLKYKDPASPSILTEAIVPYKSELTVLIADRIKSSVAEHYHSKRDDIHEQITLKIGELIANNEDLKVVKKVPLIGPQIVDNLHKPISDTIFSMYIGILESLAIGEENDTIKNLTGNIVDATLEGEQDVQLNQLIDKITMNGLEIMKERVLVKKWKTQEEKERIIKERAKKLYKHK
ncbi:MAG: ion transporter [Flavobacteriales bacterium]|nr:ion transporter [Flavobacteriales bacterium]